MNLCKSVVTDLAVQGAKNLIFPAYLYKALDRLDIANYMCNTDE